LYFPLGSRFRRPNASCGQRERLPYEIGAAVWVAIMFPSLVRLLISECVGVARILVFDMPGRKSLFVY
jgi:hypothetical protein